MAADYEPGEQISTLNTRLSSYLDKLASQVFSLEETIGQTVDINKSTDPQIIKNLQSLDFLRQSLEDLAMMALLIGRSRQTALTPREINKIAKELKLKSTRALLHGEFHGEFGKKLDQADDLDLF